MAELRLRCLHRHWKGFDRPSRLRRRGLNSNDAAKAFGEGLSLDKKSFDIDRRRQLNLLGNSPGSPVKLRSTSVMVERT